MNILRHLQVDVWVLPRVHEQVLVVGRQLDGPRADIIPLCEGVAQVVESVEPRGNARGLAVLAWPGDRVGEIGERESAGEEVERGLLLDL